MKTKTRRAIVLTMIAGCAVALTGCGDGGNETVRVDGETFFVPAPPAPLEVGDYDPLPGVVITVQRLLGATGTGGRFNPGDALSVVFSVTTTAGMPLDVSAMGGSGIMVSGPTFNYQRVIPIASDVQTEATSNGDGTWTYVFAAPLPSTYAPPYNDTPAFGSADGELTGQALLDGTYTVGLYLYMNYDVDGESIRDAGTGIFDFLVGNAPGIERRGVISDANCNECHADLRAHGGSRRGVQLCLLCHTSGSEDKQNPAVAGGTPGVSVDFKIMIHRIHNGGHLPSVHGVATAPDGTRDYTAAPQPYLIMGFRDSLHDFSDVAFPVWPNLSFPMPRDEGYSALAAGDRATEDAIRGGVTACAKCHGDPDGAGPQPAPPQGNLAYSQPSRNACGSCHDDLDYERPYTANGQTMPAGLEDGSCTLCHGQAGTPLAVMDAHRHPMLDPTFNRGLNFNVTSLTEAGAADMDGTVDPGEKIRVTFRVVDDAGVDVASSDFGTVSYVISGPTENYNLLVTESLSTSALTGSQPYTLNLPQSQLYEFVGNSTGALGDVFTTSRLPIWTFSGTPTTVRVRTGTTSSTILDQAAQAGQNYLDLLAPAGFARNDYVVIDDGVPGLEEYLRIQTVTGNRIWFSSPQTRNYAPGVRFAHSAGATVMEVDLTTLVSGTDFTRDGPTGRITELTEFGAGAAVLVDYTTDFVVPAVYPLTLNDSPDLDETWGKWAGKSLASGTYTFGMWSAINLTLDLHGETNTNYRATALVNGVDFLVGSASTLTAYDLISSGENCNSCHDDVYFHGGGRRGFDACILCHGAAAVEDRAVYVAANATNTPGELVEFKRMLHRIHMGAELPTAATYQVNGFGNTPYPNNFTAHSYAEVEFPVMPGGVEQCAKCHGATNDAWKTPGVKDHPTEQVLPARPWRTACGSCHTTAAAGAHIESQTPGGVESCAVCHGSLRVEDVVKAHFAR